MNFKNKFNVTTKKFYMVLNADEGKEGEFLFFYNGSISDYFIDETSLPLVSYAGKAIKKINRDITEKTERLADEKNNFAYRHNLLRTIANLTNTVNELSKYKEYDLVGIYEKDTYDYKVVDYKKVEELGMKDKGYKFVEISKEFYVNLANIGNKLETHRNNQQAIKIKKELQDIQIEKKQHDKFCSFLLAAAAITFLAFIGLNFWASYTDPQNKTGLDVAEDFIEFTFNPISVAQYLYHQSIEKTNYKR